jgi:hypothetical protein
VKQSNPQCEFVDLLLFWSERISSVFCIRKRLQAKGTISYQALNQFWTMTDLIKNWKYEFYVTADAEVIFNELYVLRLSSSSLTGPWQP